MTLLFVERNCKIDVFLYRTGTGRNNISWGGNTSTVGNYLRRTGTGRNNIQFYVIPQSNATYNILNRTGTGRNNITWQNYIFIKCPVWAKVPIRGAS